ncbi:MAG: DUF3343 domain-containing protein [Oscillibacter sp.]|nr:DUF3343 domain-containing protein [Oscillibacter sp.]MBQ2997128.1 DUF3343 domain-containing protein [Oscillibacter sp.]
MREKIPRLIITFPTTTAAMAMETFCRGRQLPGRLIPVPRSITAGCGVCWAAPVEAREELEETVMEHHITISGIYHVLI